MPHIQPLLHSWKGWSKCEGGMNINPKTGTDLRVIILLILLTVFAGCAGDNMRPDVALKTFVKEIESGNLANLSLTIYYLSPNVLTFIALSAEDLVNMCDVHKSVITGSRLYDNIELLRQISIDDLIPVDKKSRVNARIYYVIADSKRRKIFDVAMWGENCSIFINGREFEGRRVFYDVVIPFLPEGAFDLILKRQTPIESAIQVK